MEHPSFAYEKRLYEQGYKFIAGVDEAGRGPLAGPVTAAAVIFPKDVELPPLAGVRDSKQLTEVQRNRLYETITQTAVSWAVDQASAQEIDKVNIRQASLTAMKRALERLSPAPDSALIDGRDFPDVTLPGEALIRGDQRSVTIGAASIIAKVTRDRIMTELHDRYPDYGFDKHKGYPTRYHHLALQLFGPCDQHRATYTPVRNNKPVTDTSPPFAMLLHKIHQTRKRDFLLPLLDEVDHAALSALEREYLQYRIRYKQEYLHQANRTKNPSAVDRGSRYETLAIEYLAQQGYTLWERNYHCRKGEIDLVMNKGSWIVFVEVKSRTSNDYGMPFESVTKRKQKKIIQAAEHYLYTRRFVDQWDIRYDVISIYAPQGRSPQVDHFEDAFRIDEV